MHSSLETLCNICSEAYSTPRPPTQLKCLHIFHLDCMTNWNNECNDKKKDKVCPICREPFKETEITINKPLLSQILKAASQTIIQLLIQMPDSNRTVAQIIDTTKTVGYLLTLVSAVTGIDKQFLTLQYQTKIIKIDAANKPLADYNFQKDTVIQIIMRLKGGFV